MLGFPHGNLINPTYPKFIMNSMSFKCPAVRIWLITQISFHVIVGHVNSLSLYYGQHRPKCFDGGWFLISFWLVLWYLCCVSLKWKEWKEKIEENVVLWFECGRGEICKLWGMSKLVECLMWNFFILHGCIVDNPTESKSERVEVG